MLKNSALSKSVRRDIAQGKIICRRGLSSGLCSLSLLLLPLLITPSARAADTAVLDEVIASVDGDPITESDFKTYLKSRGEKLSAATLNKPDFYRTPEYKPKLKDMLEEELLKREAKAMGINIGAEDVEAYVAEIVKQNGVSQAEFNKVLASRGMTAESYKAQVRLEILKGRVVSAKVRPKVNVMRDEIEAYAREHHPGEFKERQQGDKSEVREKAKTEKKQKSKKIQGNHLEQVSYSRLDPAAEQLAHKARESLKDGDDASDFSEENYTDLGVVALEDLRDDLQSVVSKLSVGEVSEVVEGVDAYYVFRLSEPKESNEEEEENEAEDDAASSLAAKSQEDARETGLEGTLDIPEETEQAIKRQLLESKSKQLMEKYLSEELPKKYHVELK